MSTAQHGIRNKRDVRGKAHIYSGRDQSHMVQFRPETWPISLCGVAIRDAELVPIEQTASKDRCKPCERRSRA